MPPNLTVAFAGPQCVMTVALRTFDCPHDAVVCVPNDDPAAAASHMIEAAPLEGRGDGEIAVNLRAASATETFNLLLPHIWALEARA